MRAAAALFGIVLLCACGERPPPGHVVVYAYDGAAALGIEEMLAEFTAETGVLVTLRLGDSAQLTDVIIAKQDAPRADVLVTGGAADIWRAADSGALRPLAGETLRLVPVSLRDPDGYWIAANARMPVIIVSESASGAGFDRLDDLGDETLGGRLCLASSSLPGNRALLAAMIETSGSRDAERTIRRWVRNLALPPFKSEAELVDAVRSGTCEFGIATTSGPPGSLTQLWPRQEPRPLSVDGVGVARHATDPDAAQGLVAWIATKQGKATGLDSDVVSAVVAGWRDEEARLLAERAGYR